MKMVAGEEEFLLMDRDQKEHQDREKDTAGEDPDVVYQANLGCQE